MWGQILRIGLGSVFLFGGMWLDLQTKIPPFNLAIAYLMGTLLLFRAIPFPLWKRWEENNRLSQE